MAYEFAGDDRSELNLFMQHGLVDIGYDGNSANRICKFVIAHCNDERMLNRIHNDFKNSFNNYSEVYEDVKSILEKFVQSKSKVAKENRRFVLSLVSTLRRKYMWIAKRKSFRLF